MRLWQIYDTYFNCKIHCMFCGKEATKQYGSYTKPTYFVCELHAKEMRDLLKKDKLHGDRCHYGSSSIWHDVIKRLLLIKSGLVKN